MWAGLFLMLLLPAAPCLATERPNPPATLEVELPEVPVYEPVEETENAGPALLRMGSLQARYNSCDLGLVTPVKNQGVYGTCWAFSAIAACETSMIKQGFADNSLDLSEFHLAYFFYHSPTDPLGNTTGDRNYLSSDNKYEYMTTGGNDICSIFALSKWTGAAYESLAPYPSFQNQDRIPDLGASLAYQDAGHLQNARYVTCRDGISMKKLILEYGSVSVPVYMGEDSFDPTKDDPYTNYLNPNTNAFYYNGDKSTNHQLVLVGWDDAYQRSNFLPGRQPSSDGAWIAKNSYGESFGDNGYIYISYEDKGLRKAGSLAFAYGMENADNYSHNYQYDGSASTVHYQFTESGTGSISNVFTVKGNPGSRERLDAVSFALASQNVHYSIQIYKNPPTGNPSDGIPVFDTPQTGTTTYCGYYTVPLNQKIVFSQGDRFSVIVTLKSANGSPVYFFADATDSIFPLNLTSKAKKGQSYARPQGSSKWIDFGQTYSGNIRVKAFTTNTTEPATVVLPNISKLNTPKIQKITPKSCSELKISWSSVRYADQYLIYRSTSKKKGYKQIAVSSKTSWTDKGRKPGKHYYYRIKAQGTARKGIVYSSYSHTKSRQMLPPKVTFKSLKKKKGKQAAVLTWKKIKGASGYELYRRSAGNSWKKIKTVKKASYTDRPAKGGTYKYRIRAYKKVKKKKYYGPYSKIKKIKL